MRGRFCRPETMRTGAMRGIGARLRVDTALGCSEVLGMTTSCTTRYARGRRAVHRFRRPASEAACHPVGFGRRRRRQYHRASRARIRKKPPAHEHLAPNQKSIIRHHHSHLRLQTWPHHGEVSVDAASDDWLAASAQIFRDAPESCRDSASETWPRGQKKAKPPQTTVRHGVGSHGKLASCCHILST